MQPLVNIAVKAARNASKIILRSMDRLSSIKISKKDINDFVTEIDRAAEQEIIATIHESYPDHGILAEESGRTEGNLHTWIIDPIDGTTNFIHGLPHFSISIAVQFKNRIEHGVIYDPIRQDLFTASRGRGARLNDKRIRISQCKTLADALIGTGFPFAHPDQLNDCLQTFAAIFPHTSGVRRCGSAALDLAYVAAGMLDGFWERNLKIWDMAAGILMIKEAGGLITDFNGEENYLENGTVVTANPKLLKELLQLIKANSSK